MATIEELVDQLRTAKGALLSDRERIDAEIGRLDSAIEALSGVRDDVAAVPLAPKAAPKVTKPTKADHRKPPAPVACKDCGFECTPQNMWRHAKVCTGKPAATTTAATPQAKGPKVLACTEDGCEATFELDQFSRLNTHTVGQHGRRPSPEERTPVAA